jgi:hypothetical protein
MNNATDHEMDTTTAATTTTTTTTTTAATRKSPKGPKGLKGGGGAASWEKLKKCKVYQQYGSHLNLIQGGGANEKFGELQRWEDAIPKGAQIIFRNSPDFRSIYLGNGDVVDCEGKGIGSLNQWATYTLKLQFNDNVDRFISGPQSCKVLLFDSKEQEIHSVFVKIFDYIEFESLISQGNTSPSSSSSSSSTPLQWYDNQIPLDSIKQRQQPHQQQQQQQVDEEDTVDLMSGSISDESSSPPPPPPPPPSICLNIYPPTQPQQSQPSLPTLSKYLPPSIIATTETEEPQRKIRKVNSQVSVVQDETLVVIPNPPPPLVVQDEPLPVIFNPLPVISNPLHVNPSPLMTQGVWKGPCPFPLAYHLSKDNKEISKNLERTVWEACYGKNSVGTCMLCGVAEVDFSRRSDTQLCHINPKCYLGRSDKIYNMIFACGTCNNKGETRTSNVFDQLYLNGHMDNIGRTCETALTLYCQSEAYLDYQFEGRLDYVLKVHGSCVQQHVAQGMPNVPSGVMCPEVFHYLQALDRHYPLPSHLLNPLERSARKGKGHGAPL